MNFTDTTVYRYIEATRAAEAATAAMFESFGIVRRTIRSVGGAYVRGYEVSVNDARMVLATPWGTITDRGEWYGLPLLYVGTGVDRHCVGVIESERLRDGAGHVAYVVNTASEHDHRYDFELIVLDETMEKK